MDPNASGSPDIIHAYLAKDAEEYGLLINTGTRPLEFGFTIPVLLTKNAWEAAIEWTRDDEFQTEEGRLTDVLWMCRRSYTPRPPSIDPWEFAMVCIPNTTPKGTPSKAHLPQRLVLEATWNAYDTTGTPCLIIGLPGED